jgi:hypothetical protein
MPYKVKKQVDYIACSVSSFEVMDDVFGSSEDTTPRQRNYNRAKVFEIGVFMQWHDANPKMKISLIMSGETLQKLRDVGFADYDILKWLRDMPKCSFSRIDVCVTSMRTDDKIHGFLPHAINYLAVNGMCETRLKVDNPVTSPELEVETAYIGSRTSRNRIFRAYDKGIELGLEAMRIVRYELETRKNATHIATELVIDKTDIGALIRRYIDFPQIEEWVEIMGSVQADNWKVDSYETEADKNNRRWDWLMSSVAPAMAKALYQDNVDVSENENADKFAAAVAFYYNKLIDNANN